MLRLTVLSTAAAFVAFLFFAIPAQADEIEPEIEAEVEPEVEPEVEHVVESTIEPEPEPEPVLERDDDYARNGAYVGANLAGAWYTEVKDDVRDAIEAADLDLKLDLESPLGIGIRAGYRFLPWLAGEFQFQWFSKAKVEVSTIDTTSDFIKFETITFTGNLKAYPLTGRIQPFVLTGIGLMHADVDDKMGFGTHDTDEDFAARFGAGVDLYANRNFVVVVEGGYVLPTGSLDGMDYVFWSVGLNYRF
jgi:opacity protein-like surface antigen